MRRWRKRRNTRTRWERTGKENSFCLFVCLFAVVVVVVVAVVVVVVAVVVVLHPVNYDGYSWMKRRRRRRRRKEEEE